MKTLKLLLSLLIGLSFTPLSAQFYAPEIKVQDTNNKVGIGTNAPLEDLSIYGKSGSDMQTLGIGPLHRRKWVIEAWPFQRDSELVGHYPLVFKRVMGNNHGDFVIRNKGGDFVVEDGGRVGIGGMLKPRYTLHINGNAACTGGYWSASDAKLKKNIEKYNGGLAIVKKLNPVKYELKAETDSIVVRKSDKAIEKKPRKYVSVLAQELQQAAPELVDTYMDENDEGTLSINQTGLIFVLVNSIKELDAKVAEQQALIEALQKKK